MTTYKTYQEAKIANPECEIYTGGNGFASGDGFALNAIRTVQLSVLDSYKCNPADYCMTVEKFLADGYRFVKSDVVFDFGDVVSIDTEFDVETYNKTDKMDDRRYTLRAAALEEKKPHTKVEYVKCEFSSDYEHLKLMIDGEKFYTWDGDVEYSFNGARFIGKEKPNHNMHAEWTNPKPTELYRRIETQMTEREAFIEQCEKLSVHADKLNIDEARIVERMFDSGKFKLVN